jgi:hypothetical protein
VIPLSLLLVLASLGLLAAGLAEGSSPLVWASLIASLSACGCLVGSVLQHRRAALTATPDQAAAQPIDVGAPASDPALPASISPAQVPWTSPPASAPPEPMAPASPFRQPADADPAPQPAAPAARAAAAPDPTRAAAPTDDLPGSPASPAQGELADEPAVEDIPVADALRVAQLSDEVLVVDGRPRYHLAGCPHLADRATIPLPVSAARRAGFTPCAACQPDSTLLARSRSIARPPR